ncbi:hypothetical protein WNZ14_06400 [Hoeflea sp. AS60]|uniref:hypothetical protein n=1 Tax=Hoeflea sp. AS60 TaxID=3135780 RepID=UPI003175E8C4
MICFTEMKPATSRFTCHALAGILAAISLLTPACIKAASAEDTKDMTLSLDQIFSVATGDWNKDNAQDAVVMIETSNQEFDVLIYLTDENHRLKLHDYVKSMVWGATTMYGQEPFVSTRENGSLMITSQNSAIGRDRWEENLTIVYRQNRFIVAGFSYSSYDTLDPDGGGSCDLNLLTGKGIVNEEAIKFDAKAPSILAYADQSEGLRKLCGVPE